MTLRHSIDGVYGAIVVRLVHRAQILRKRVVRWLGRWLFSAGHQNIGDGCNGGQNHYRRENQACAKEQVFHGAKSAQRACQSQFSCVLVVGALLTVGTFYSRGQIVASTNRISWIPGYSVGVQIERTNRTVSLNVTNFGADASGETNANTPIMNAIAAAAASSGVTNVVFFPAGRYRIVAGITMSAANSGITLRGETNASGALLATLFGQDTGAAEAGGSTVLYVGPQDNPSVYYPITNGATKGSTNIILDLGYVPDGATGVDASLLASGYIIEIAGERGSNPEQPVFSTGGYDKVRKQHAAPIAVSGQTVTLSAPLVMDFSATHNPTAKIIGTPPIRGVGIEFLKFMGSNAVSGITSTQQTLLWMSSARDSWVIGCEFSGANNYHVALASCVNVTVKRNRMTRANSVGSNHAGILFNSSSCLIEDNIIDDGIFPGMEINAGMGNAFFANFMTNNVQDILIHNAHPGFNLFEANVLSDMTFDGYFGSSSHATALRNNIYGAHVYFKRWTTFQQWLGNVMGYPTNGHFIYTSDSTSYTPVMFRFGEPNVGNHNSSGTTPPTAWNYPGNFVTLNNPPETQWTNGVFTITNGPAFPTNVIWTNFGIGTLTNLPAPEGGNFPLVFQDTANTNYYYGGRYNAGVLTLSAGNSSNVTLDSYVILSNGWRVFVAGANQFQQLQNSNRWTHTIVSNLCYTNLAGVIVNDDIATGVGSGIVSNSFLYASAPDYWGTNRWPAIQFDAAQPVSPIPAEDRYYGRIAEGEGEGGAVPSSAGGAFTIQGSAVFK